MQGYYLLNQQQADQLRGYSVGGTIIVTVFTIVGESVVEDVDTLPGVANILTGSKKYYIDDNGNVLGIVVAEVPTWRLRAVLALDGKEADVQNAINSLPEPNKTIAQRAWEFGSNTERTSNTVAFIQSVLSLTDTEVDNYFIQANELQA